MDKGTRSLLTVVLSVLLPVLILEHCSAPGEALWQLGTTRAMVLALSLPIGCGLWIFARERRADTITLLGLGGTLLTGVVTLYANTGDTLAIRPDAPWWYAAKEALVAGLLGAAVWVTGARPGSLLRLFVYADSLFDIARIERRVAERGCGEGYARILRRACFFTGLSLLLSAAGNFLLSLWFLLPVCELPAEAQPLAYNEAVGSMMWWSYVVIGVPLLGTLLGVVAYLRRALSRLTGLSRGEISLL